VKKVVSVAVTVSLLVITFSGCAPKANQVPASYVSHSKYMNKSCEALDYKMENISKELVLATKDQNSAHNRDVAMAVVGTILFWPAYFAMAISDDSEHLSYLKGEYQALDEAMINKGCYQNGKSGVDYIKEAEQNLGEDNNTKSSNSDISNNEFTS
jgi:hypothetical protein